MFTRIVVPLDGSETAEQALAPAAELARLIHVPLHLVEVIDLARLQQIGAYGMELVAAPIEEMLLAERDTATAYLADVQKRLTAEGLQVTVSAPVGLIVQRILEATQPSDLLVIASHGRSGVQRWFLGSVAEDVMRRSPVPVMLVRAPQGAATRPVDAAARAT